LYIDNTRQSDRRDQVGYSLFMSQAAWPHERPRNVIMSFPVDTHSRKRTRANPPLSIEHPSPVKKRRYPRFRITPHRPTSSAPNSNNQPTHHVFFPQHPSRCLLRCPGPYGRSCWQWTGHRYGQRRTHCSEHRSLGYEGLLMFRSHGTSIGSSRTSLTTYSPALSVSATSRLPGPGR